MRFAKTVIFTLLMAATLTLSAAVLPPAFTAKGNPTLYKKLKPLALANLRKLDSPQRKAYRRMLRDQDDILMAYLLGYESDAVLQAAEPADVMSNYLQVRSLLNTRGTELDPEFYLSYVADQTVSDERIQAYREALLKDGLREILDSAENEMELYRAVSQWCVARLKFMPTSGRDQSPLDITQKSLLGRCEEMQILFVAAARTVGLPARAASTPWWPHTDNNHAWAEVWLDNAWHYTGDMDAAYYPDQTWFSGMIDKTVLILADGSLPAPSDEVLSRGRYECVINSIRNYAGERTRNLSVTTLNENGSPLPKASVGVMVYNWGALRALTYFQTDDKGVFRLSVGRGAFYLLSAKDDKQALELVPSGEETDISCTLRLSSSPLPPQDAMLVYPANPFTWKQAPEVWNEGVRKAVQRWKVIDQSYLDHYSYQADSLVGELAAAMRGNTAEFRRYLERNPEPDHAFLAFATSTEPQMLDPKFLWQASAEQIEALQTQFQAWAPDFSPDELSSVVSPNVFYEDLSRPFLWEAGRHSLYPRHFLQRGNDPMERLGKAMAWLKKNYRIKPAKALQGLIPLDIAVSRKYLNSYQYRILAVSVARANGIPAEFSRQPDRIFVKPPNGPWSYYDLRNLALETETGSGGSLATLEVLLSDEIGAPLGSDLVTVKLTRFRDGAFFDMDQSWKKLSSGLQSTEVPQGEYYLNVGYRVSDSRTAYQLQALDLNSQEPLRVSVVCPEYPRNWSDAPQEIVSLLGDIDTTDVEAVLIGSLAQENSIRLMEKLRLAGKRSLWVHFDQRVPSGQNGQFFSPQWLELTEQDGRNRVRTITLLRRGDRWQYFEGLWDKLPE